MATIGDRRLGGGWRLELKVIVLVVEVARCVGSCAGGDGVNIHYRYGVVVVLGSDDERQGGSGGGFGVRGHVEICRYCCLGLILMSLLLLMDKRYFSSTSGCSLVVVVMVLMTRFAQSRCSLMLFVGCSVFVFGDVLILFFALVHAVVWGASYGEVVAVVGYGCRCICCFGVVFACEVYLVLLPML